MRQHVLLALAGVSALAFAASARAAEAPTPTGQLLLEARTRYELYDPDGPDAEANTQKTIAYCRDHPRWRLSLQTHKLIGLP